MHPPTEPRRQQQGARAGQTGIAWLKERRGGGAWLAKVSGTAPSKEGGSPSQLCVAQGQGRSISPGAPCSGSHQKHPLLESHSREVWDWRLGGVLGCPVVSHVVFVPKKFPLLLTRTVMCVKSQLKALHQIP